MSQKIQKEWQDRVLTIRINRPEKKNALTRDMYLGIASALDDAASNPEVRVVVITGAGTSFTSGNDLQDFIANTSNETFEASPLGRFMHALSTFHKPVIAAVNGMAIGIGTTLLLHCDLVYLASDVRLQLPFANIGACPEFASSYLLPRLMGHAKAANLLLFGEPFTAQTALEIGLATEVVSQEDLLAHARARGLKLAKQPPGAIRSTKALLRKWRSDEVAQVMKIEVALFTAMLKQEEAQEGIGAVMEKRQPDFSRFS